MKIAVLIPTRGNRPELLENCLRMIRNQTVQPDHIEVVNDTPLSKERDITLRYRLGYERLRNKSFDVIFLMEDDDYYSPEYIETMLSAWNDAGRPNIFGTSYTIYYNIGLFAWHPMAHNTRSSAMSTMIAPNLNLTWCVDNDPFTDIHLWRTVKGKVFTPEKHICLGIKHGTTMTGGKSHVDRLHRYINKDKDHKFLYENMDIESYNFYSNFMKHYEQK